jgi:hypothetical protein
MIMKQRTDSPTWQAEGARLPQRIVGRAQITATGVADHGAQI